MQAPAKTNGFVARLREVCNDMQLPEHGRQTMLAKRFGVTQGATKKWLNGEGFPNMDKIVAICEWADVNVNWLVMGTGPKKTGGADIKTVVLGEALQALPDQDRQQVMDFIGYKIERADGLFVGERLARYMTMLDAFKADRDKRPK